MGSAVFEHFALLLYPKEDETHENAINLFETYAKLWDWKYFYITHDKDLDDNGDIKKSHVHVVLVTEKKAPNSIAKRLGIEKNYVQGVSNPRGYLEYLIHAKDPEKYQYNCDEVITNCDYVDYTKSLHKNLSFDAQLSMLLDLIDVYLQDGQKVTYLECLRDSQKLGFAPFVVKNHQMVSKLLDTMYI